MCRLRHRLRIFFVSEKSYVSFSRYSSFCIFNHLFIYPIQGYSSSLVRAIIARNHLPSLKIFSNFEHFCPNFQIFCPFLPFFWKKACILLLSRIGPAIYDIMMSISTGERVHFWIYLLSHNSLTHQTSSPDR